jgi:hypothetical protein
MRRQIQMRWTDTILTEGRDSGLLEERLTSSQNGSGDSA